MRARPVSRPVEGPLQTASATVQAALLHLLEGYDYAADLKRPVWTFPVEWPDLRAGGLRPNTLRWLIGRGYVEHAYLTARGALRPRSVGRTGEFTERSRLVLTKAGAALARGVEVQAATAAWSQADPPGDGLPLPCWDGDRHTLCVGRYLIKVFRQPAPNQEAVLAAFEAAGWRPRVANPLPPVLEIDDRQLLHDTIHNLNRFHRHRLLRFHGDGSGLGVCWSWILPRNGLLP